MKKLIDSGIRIIEAISFANKKVAPQMAETEEMMLPVPKRDVVD